mmetsp:Transcript_34113/g.71251  ORF Transcript_34113/g.71251 Transcript_34113/m.71251 type:complete len:280 (-) Transcript_34113:116-955(-)
MLLVRPKIRKSEHRSPVDRCIPSSNPGIARSLSVRGKNAPDESLAFCRKTLARIRKKSIGRSINQSILETNDPISVRESSAVTPRTIFRALLRCSSARAGWLTGVLFVRPRIGKATISAEARPPRGRRHSAERDALATIDSFDLDRESSTPTSRSSSLPSFGIARGRVRAGLRLALLAWRCARFSARASQQHRHRHALCGRPATTRHDRHGRNNHPTHCGNNYRGSRSPSVPRQRARILWCHRKMTKTKTRTNTRQGFLCIRVRCCIQRWLVNDFVLLL